MSRILIQTGLAGDSYSWLTETGIGDESGAGITFVRAVVPGMVKYLPTAICGIPGGPG